MNAFRAFAGTLTALALAACSSGGSSTTSATPPAGPSYSAYLPLQPGNRYECDTGLVLRVESATEPNLGTQSAARVVIEHDGRVFGVYWAEDAVHGKTHHGSFDATSGHQVVLQDAVPVVTTRMRVPIDVDEFWPIGQLIPNGRGQMTIQAEDPSLLNPNRPAIHSFDTVYGNVLFNRIVSMQWKFDFTGTTGTYLQELYLSSLPEHGPVTIAVDGKAHQVVRAVVRGVEYRWPNR